MLHQLIKRYFLANSLKHRILLSAFLSVLILLPSAGYFISNAYEKHMASSLKNELAAHAYAVLAVADFEQKQLTMPDVLLENQFNTFESGLYAIFINQEQPDNALWQSTSLISTQTPKPLLFPQLGQSSYYAVDYLTKSHYVFSLSVSFESQGENFPVTLHILKQQDDIILLLEEFKQKMWLSLALLMGVLLFLQLVWLQWSLKPLSQLSSEIADIEQGKADHLKQNYPVELKQVTEQLNTLLKTEQHQRSRYRNALSDLAHSLKTPLAVIKGENQSSIVDQQVDMMTAIVEHQLTRAQSAGHASWHLGINIEQCLQKLLPSLQKIYNDKSLLITHDLGVKVSTFKGDEADLLEILGNLLDNACKAAKEKINVCFFIEKNQLNIIVEDDGVGINEQQKSDILKRGVRADNYQNGHGIGLAIVRDLVSSYDGTLNIENSIKLKGAKFIIKFNGY